MGGPRVSRGQPAWCRAGTAASRRDRLLVIAECDTAVDEIVRTYPAFEVFAKQISFAALDDEGGRG